MNAKKRKNRPSAGASGRPAKTAAERGNKQPQASQPSAGLFSRDAVESIVIAIVLALLFRTFEAEAFVIPTGSMAPTLWGRNRETVCPQCNHQFAAGDSEQNEVDAQRPIYSVTCPLCRYVNVLDPQDPNQGSFGGDRILVNKFAYQFSDPKRWDVIVFKNPSNAKQNYIKRLIGLPHETVRVQSGDIHISKDEGPFEIARKPPKKLRHLLQLVHDTQHIPEELTGDNWPSSWRDTSEAGGASWEIAPDYQRYSLAASSGGTSWLSYRHIPPRDWRQISSAMTEYVKKYGGQLITDFSGYNTASYHRSSGRRYHDGLHWVGDLAMDVRVQVKSSAGEIVLRLVEGGRNFDCVIDVSTGMATLTTPDQVPFDDTDENRLSGATKIKRPGTYDISFANVDDQLSLWVGGKLVSFQRTDGTDHHAGYQGEAQLRPAWSPDEPGDLQPLRVGGRNVDMEIEQLRVLRDLYYIAIDADAQRERHFGSPTADYLELPDSPGPNPASATERILYSLRTPETWATSPLFSSRRVVEKKLGADQFFPMGDNSALSKDARLWYGNNEPSLFVPGGIKVDHWVERDRLIGKAFMIYFPHPWKVGKFPIIPHVERMGRIR